MLQKVKFCSKCGEKFPATAKYFYKDKRRIDNLANPCRECKRKYEKTPHAKQLDRKRHLKYEYNIGIKIWEKLFQVQNGRCAICEKHQSQLKRSLDIDHNHKTNEIRGLLCNYCNKIIERHINNPSFFKNPIIIKQLQRYLKK